MPIRATGTSYVWSSSPFEGAYASFAGPGNFIRHGLKGEDVIVAGEADCWVGAKSYPTVANGWSCGYRIPAGETRTVRLVARGGPHSFSVWEVAR